MAKGYTPSLDHLRLELAQLEGMYKFAEDPKDKADWAYKISQCHYHMRLKDRTIAPWQEEKWFIRSLEGGAANAYMLASNVVYQGDQSSNFKGLKLAMEKAGHDVDQSAAGTYLLRAAVEHHALACKKVAQAICNPQKSYNQLILSSLEKYGIESTREVANQFTLISAIGGDGDQCWAIYKMLTYPQEEGREDMIQRLSGLDIPEDEKMAMHFLVKAMKNEQPDACWIVSQIYDDTNNLDEKAKLHAELEKQSVELSPEKVEGLKITAALRGRPQPAFVLANVILRPDKERNKKTAAALEANGIELKPEVAGEFIVLSALSRYPAANLMCLEALSVPGHKHYPHISAAFSKLGIVHDRNLIGTLTAHACRSKPTKQSLLDMKLQGFASEGELMGKHRHQIYKNALYGYRTQAIDMVQSRVNRNPPFAYPRLKADAA